MRITIDGAALHAAASWVAKLAPAKPAMPVVGGILIDAGEQLTLSATDLNVFGTVTAAGTVTQDGQVVVSARLLAAITKTLRRDDQVTIISDSGPHGRVEVRCGKARWALPGMEHGSWPAWPDMGDQIGTIPVEALVHALARVLPATSGPLEPPMNGGVVLHTAGVLTIAATDRYRVAAAELDWQPILGTGRHQLIVPGDLLRTAVGAIKGSAGDVVIYADDNTIGLACDGHRIVGRQLDGYPKWEQVMLSPGQVTDTTAVVDVAALVQAIERVAVVLEDKESLQVSVTEEGIQVSPSVGEGGDADQYADLQDFQGKPITFWATAQYLREALTCLDSPVAVLSFCANPARPFLLRPSSENSVIEDGYRHVVMPRQVPRVVRAAA